MDAASFYDGVVVVQFQFSTDDKPIVLDASVAAHKSSTLTESVFEPALFEHQFITQRLDIVDSILRLTLAQPTPIVRFRYGINAEKTTNWMPWSQHLLTSFSALPVGVGEAAGHILHIVSNDPLYAWNRQSKVVCRKGKISSIVAQIASENGIENTVIEETDTEGVYYQAFEGDTEFVMQRLLRRSVNKKGFGNYLFFYQDDALHFHTPDYSTRPLYANYYNAGGLNLALVDHTQKLYEGGIGGTRIVRYDPYTGNSNEISSDPSKALRYATVAHNLNVAQSQYNVPYHSGANGDKECVAIAQSVYDLARISAFRADFTLPRMTNIRAGCLLNIDITPSSRSEAASGFYLVSRTSVSIVNGRATTALALQRGETGRLPVVQTTVGDENKLIPVLEAPGQDVNIPAVTSSQTRSGAGKQTSDRTFTILSDANRGPA
jgi:hypothetical protein